LRGALALRLATTAAVDGEKKSWGLNGFFFERGPARKKFCGWVIDRDFFFRGRNFFLEARSDRSPAGLDDALWVYALNFGRGRGSELLDWRGQLWEVQIATSGSYLSTSRSRIFHF